MSEGSQKAGKVKEETKGEVRERAPTNYCSEVRNSNGDKEGQGGSKADRDKEGQVGSKADRDRAEWCQSKGNGNGSGL